MALLPLKVGSVTLMRSIGNDGVTESFVGILDRPAGKQVIVRRVLPAFSRDEARFASLKGRVGDLLLLRHPLLLPLLEVIDQPGEYALVYDWVDAVTLADVVRWCVENQEAIPHNVFLHLAVQMCNGLEALHSRPGAASGSKNVLHHCVRPESVLLTRDGELHLSDFGLVRSPTLAPHSGGIRMKTAYLSPEQTHQDQPLTPASDLFSLGAVLYEVLALKPMFKDSTPLRTIARVRGAEVTTQLLEIKEILPGLDHVLYRALALNPRHRYQRAFVMREDLRGLMAGFSFSDIEGECRAFLEPLFQGRVRALDDLPEVRLPTRDTQGPLLRIGDEPTGSLLDDTLPNVRLLDLQALKPEDAPPLAGLDPTIGQFLVPDADTEPTGGFDLPVSAGPIARPVNYSHDPGTDEQSLPSVTRHPLAHIVAVPSEIPPETSEELDLLPTRAPAEPTAGPARGPAPEERASAIDPEPSADLVERIPRRPAPREIDDEPAAVAPTLAVAGVGAGVLAMLGLLCMGGTVVGAVGMSARGTPVAVADVADVEPELLADAADAAVPVDPTPVSAGGRDGAPPPAPAAIARAATRSAPARPRSAPPMPGRVGGASLPSESPQAPDPRGAARSIEPSLLAALGAVPQDPTLKDADWDVDMLVAERLSPLPTASFTAPPPPEPPVGAARIASAPLDLSALATDAYAGQLSAATRAALGEIPTSDADFTRAHVLVYHDAKARGDHAARRAAMVELLSTDENRYRPELLVERAAIALVDRDWATAREFADRAEQHWSRLPRDLIPTRKAMIHEIQGNASFALYAASDPPSDALLDAAIDAWTRYRTHALGLGRKDMIANADQRLAQLDDVRKRMR